MIKLINQLEETTLRQRMYSIVLYNLSPIQQGIQTTHAIVEYAQTYFLSPEYQRWANFDKTLIILNGGSSIKMKVHMEYLQMNEIVKFVAFKEPDLYDGVTAFSFLADERVWDREKYPDRLPPLEPVDRGNGVTMIPAIHRMFDLEAFKEKIGGEKNFLLKEFLSQFKLA